MSSLYMRKPVTPEIVEAEYISEGAQHHPQGARPARPGEWVLTNHTTGQQQTLTNEEFQRDYVALTVPAHMLAPTPGTGADFQPQDVRRSVEAQPYDYPANQPEQIPVVGTPQAEPPAPPNQPGQGDVEISTPMNENVVGRPAPTPEVKPRLQEPGPITTESGTPEVREDIPVVGTPHTESDEVPNEPERSGPPLI